MSLTYCIILFVISDTVASTVYYSVLIILSAYFADCYLRNSEPNQLIIHLFVWKKRKKKRKSLKYIKRLLLLLYMLGRHCAIMDMPADIEDL